MPALQGCPTWIASVRTLRHFVINAHHLNGLSGSEFVKAQIHGAPAIVPGAMAGIGDENLLVIGSRVPKYLRDVPGTVGVVNQKAIAHFHELFVST